LLSFIARRANIPTVRIVGLGDSAEATQQFFVELRSRCLRPRAHSGSQGLDRKGQPNTLGAFPGGFTGNF